MFGRCIANTQGHLHKEVQRRSFAENVHNTEVNLEIGRLYQIYGVVFRTDTPWYLVLIDEDDDYPVPQLGAFFELTESRIPAGRCFTFQTPVWEVAILPERWSKDPRFLEKLIDDDLDEIKFLRSLKTSAGQ